MFKYKNKLKGIVLVATLLMLFGLVASAGREVYIGGFPFGVKMTTDGVVVSGISDIESTVGKVSPAREAGMREGDIIVAINGEKVDGIDEVANIISSCGGKRLKMDLLRDGKSVSVNLIPVQTADKNGYKTGLYIKDSASGIGTVTYVLEDKQSFGGLGHGITDRITTELLPLKEGTVHNVEITSVAKGTSEAPGELKGALSPITSGSLLKNTEMGVMGKFDKKLKLLDEIEVADVGEIKEGECTIYTCLHGNTPTKLDGEIVKIVDKNAKTKNFIVSLTDKEGIENAGGIVQGM